MNFGDMVEIKDISGKILFSVLLNENSKFVEELMTSDYIQLSWVSDNGAVIPISSYVEYNGEKYRLLEPYTPQMDNELKYVYTPIFHSRVMVWDKQIVPVYTYSEDGNTIIGKEFDWSFTGSPVDAMYIIKQAIKNETGEDWSIQIGEVPATISISSQSTSILSMLNTIASECDTEWWADKKDNTLYLSKCVYGEPITLEVGNNVQAPTVTNDNRGYFTRFYAFGSTRNITQDYDNGQATNHVVNKRLTLNPAKFPGGYKDIKEGLTANEIFVKVLYFDDVYPSSRLTISDVRARLKYRLDNSGNKIKIGGTEEEPIYEQYAIWFFQIENFTFNVGSVIEGKTLSVSFESGQLAGREFELKYHNEAETVKDGNDVTSFYVKAGDFEIILDESTGTIIPGLSYIIPQDGDSVVLFNIIMPDEYITSAQNELEEKLDKEISLLIQDNNIYKTSSYPTVFYNNNIDIRMGQAVTFINKTNQLSTRVQAVEKRLDLPCYQTIKLGNKIMKGNTQQLKDEVASVNQDLDVIKAFNELSNSLSNAYANAQREMIEGFATIKNLWQLKQDDEGNYYAYTEYDVLGGKGMTAYSAGTSKIPSIFEGLPLDNVTIWKNPNTGLIEVIGGTGGGSDFDATAMWAALSAATNEQINKSHLTDALNGYATESWVEGKGYALQTSLDAVSTKLNDFLDGSDTDTIINKWKELEAFLSGMAETDNLAEILSNKADTSYVNTEFSKYVTLATEQDITAIKHFNSGLSVGDGKHRLYEQDGIVYFDGDLAVTGGITTYALGSKDISTIMDGVAVDGTTIAKVDGVLKVLNAGGGEAGSVAWSNITDKPSWIGDTKPSYVWSEIGNKPTTLGDYGITDAYTKTDSDNRFVNVSGDTMTGGLTIQRLTISHSNEINSSDYVYLGYRDTINGVNVCFNNKPFTYGSSRYTVWHAGNDGHGSGLDADLLDGLDWNNFFSRRYYTFDLNSYSTSNFYPLFFTASDIELDCEIHSNNTYGGDAYNQNRIHFQLTTQGWYDTGMSFHLLSQNNYDDNEITIGAIGRGQHDGGICIWVRGGRTYRVYSNREPVFKSSNYTYGDEVYSVGTNLWGGTNTYVDVIWKNDSTRKERMITTNDGNIASATKLQTARTIWGQSFDGTGNVSGELSQCTRIYNAASNPIYIGNSNNSSWVYTQDIASSNGIDKWAINVNGSSWFKKVNIGYTYNAEGTYLLNVNGTAKANSLASTNIRIECDNSGVLNGRNSEINNYNNHLYLQHNSSTNLYCCVGGGNVGIGTTTPTYKLDVNGDIISSYWIRTRGQTGWYSETYGGGWYMIDSTYIRAYGDKKVYSGNGYLSPYSAGTWISMATRANIIDGDQNQSTDGAHALYRVKSSSGHAVCFGGLGDTVGFYGFYKSRIDANSNGTDWSTTWNTTNGTLTHVGNFLSTGGITCYSSDQRAKTVIEQISLSLKQIANAPTIRFKWNNWKIKDDGKTHIGGIAQYMQKLLPETVLEADDMLNMDYATTGYIFAVQTAKHLVKTDTEVEKLKKRVKRLEKQLKQLGYEEANIMDD